MKELVTLVASRAGPPLAAAASPSSYRTLVPLCCCCDTTPDLSPRSTPAADKQAPNHNLLQPL